MRTMINTFKMVRNSLAVYGAVCLISGIAAQQIERSWSKVLHHTEDYLSELIFGHPVERPIEVEFEEVD